MTFGVWATFTEVLACCVREWRALVRHGAIPFVVIVLSTLLAPSYFAPEASLGHKAIGMTLVAAQMLVCVPMVVTWYRMIVLGRDEGARQRIFSFGEREWRMLGWQLVILAITLVVFAVGAGIVVSVDFALAEGVAALVVCFILSAGGIIGVLTVINRISFIFALAAIDQPVSFKTSWNLTRGPTWPLVWTLSLITLGETLIVSLTNVIGGIVAATVHGAATVFTFAAMATLFGRVYVRVRGRSSPASEAPA